MSTEIKDLTELNTTAFAIKEDYITHYIKPILIYLQPMIEYLGLTLQYHYWISCAFNDKILCVASGNTFFCKFIVFSQLTPRCGKYNYLYYLKKAKINITKELPILLSVDGDEMAKF